MTGTDREPADLVPRIWTCSPISVFVEMERTLNGVRTGSILPENDIEAELTPPTFERGLDERI